MKENIVREKSFEFALQVIEIYEHLSGQREYIISRQILRSGTSIGANIREAEHAVSKPDFINKMSIALKEANETEYWLELLERTKYSYRQIEICKQKVRELLRLLISIINSTKSNIKK